MQNANPENLHSLEEYTETGKILGYFKAGQENLEIKRDSFLWKAFLSDSQEAFSEIFLKYNPKLITIGLKLGFDRKSVEDCIQDLFLNLWTRRQQLKEVNSVKYYLIVSLRRALFHQNEKKSRTIKLISGIRSEYPSIELPAMWDDELNKYRVVGILKSIDLLPKRQMQAIKLRYIEEKPYQEIASVMNVDVHSVRKFVFKAIKSLKNILCSAKK